MNTRMTLFSATLVQDSALSVSGLDREASADQPFTVVNGVPTLVGRGLKGAVVAMAKRFFDPLPRAVSDDIKHGALRRSAWEFVDAKVIATPRLRAGIGIKHKTGARAGGVLYDREVISAGNKWQLNFRVDWSQIPIEIRDDEGHEAEGILGYVLAKHWAQGRCWLGGSVARGLGWCHLEDLKAWRLNDEDYEAWIVSGRTTLPDALLDLPTVEPTRSWWFRELKVSVTFGEYRPDSDSESWGLDMLACGTHSSERTVQPTGDGNWARPAWASDCKAPAELSTDRAILMDGMRPLLPGASLRGQLRNVFSRRERAAGRDVRDPHLFKETATGDDLAERIFGSVARSSRLLICDSRAEEGWAAAKLHMHAEDEFSAGSYESAKRDAVRLIQGSFPVRIVVEGETAEIVDELVRVIDRQVTLGTLGHLPVGGHRTRGAGWGRWLPQPWEECDVIATRSWSPSVEASVPQVGEGGPTSDFHSRPESAEVWVRTESGDFGAVLTLGEAAKAAKAAFKEQELVAWWCEPSIDLDLSVPPPVFGKKWPGDDELLKVDEVAFYAHQAVWRAAMTAQGVRFAAIFEVAGTEPRAELAEVIFTPALLHGFRHFSSANTGRGSVLLREWKSGAETLGFTLSEVN